MALTSAVGDICAVGRRLTASREAAVRTRLCVGKYSRRGGDPVRLHLAASYVAVAAVLFTGCVSERELQGSPVSAASTDEPVDPATDIKAVRSVFEDYRVQVGAENGSAVPALVSPSTIAHYDAVVRAARAAGPAEIAELRMMDRLMVARMRVEEPPGFATMDGAGLLVYAVNEGMIDATALQGNALGEVLVEGDRAYAEMLVDDEPTGVDWEFVRGEPGWTFDLAAGFPLINETLSQVAAEGGMTEDEFIFEAIELVTGRPVDASVYEQP